MISRLKKHAPHHTGWSVAEWGLFACWVTAAIYDMYPNLPGGHVLVGSFLTTHLADLTLPAWMYIVLRKHRSQASIFRRVARSPEATALLLFLASTLSELSQIWWPNGLFRGAFDPLDLAAYAVGLTVCYIGDKFYGISSIASPIQSRGVRE
jgi:hypothetical protein